MKIQLAMGNLMEGVNTVSAFCDFGQLLAQASQYIDFGDITNDWDKYVVLGGRLGGFAMGQLQVELACIQEAYVAGIGYDAGQCSAAIAKALLDTEL
jgi:hypothetical protein